MIICVTNDKYEHTIAITDTAVEMAKITGFSVQTIYRDCRGQRKLHKASCVPYRFYKISEDDNEND